MESELERFHKQNTNLELNIEELKLKLKATEKEMYQERQKVIITLRVCSSHLNNLWQCPQHDSASQGCSR